MKLGGKKKDKPAARGEKKAKRKSSRGSGDGLAKLKLFVANHVEKLLLAAMALFALLLVYSGIRKDVLQTDPENVAMEVSRAQSSINSSTWAQVKQERQPEPDRFDEQATQDTDNIDLNAYAMNVPFHPRLQEQGKKRTDPELLAPFDIEVRAGYGALAIKATGQDSNIASVVERSSPDLRPIPSEMMIRGRGDAALGGHYQSRFFVAITGLVPYKKQFDVYVDAFKGAAEYNSERDTPTYRGLRIERAEVQPDGSLADWQSLNTFAGMVQEPSTWDTPPDEQAEPSHLIPGLNMNLPPLVMRDVSQWARHSTVPMAELNSVGGEDRGGHQAEEGVGNGENAESWEDFVGAGTQRGEARVRGPRSGASGAKEMSEDGLDADETAQPELQVENGMLRYFDFTVQPGKKYKYRVQAQLLDPNNPADGPKPSVASCETEVVMRRQSATESVRRTAWSEPSDTVVVPTGHRVLASTAVAANTVLVEPEPGRRIRIEKRATDEPTINVVTLTWKADGPFDVPIPLKVGRGAVLNGSTPKAEAIDPVAARVRALTNYRFNTDAMVLDIYGGATLPGSELASPGFMLVRTADGRLELHAESADISQVQRYTIPPAEIEARADRQESTVESRGEETQFEEPRGEGGRGGRGGNRTNRSRGGG